MKLARYFATCGLLLSGPAVLAQDADDTIRDFRVEVSQDDESACVYGDGHGVEINRMQLAFMLVNARTSETRLILSQQDELAGSCVSDAVEMVEGFGFAEIVTENYDAEAALEDEHPEATPYDPAVDTTARVDAALERAAANGKRVLLVMGGNWCHDSRGLAGWFETPRFAEMLETAYEVVYVNIGLPQTGDGFNLEIARRFGIEEITGTPTVLVLSGEGELLNPETAITWNNAASRSEDEIFDYFAEFEAEAPPES